MFIEYEIKEYDEIYSSILNTDHIVGIEVTETEHSLLDRLNITN